ncbi:MAG: FAD-dependent oxidoreductase [Actinobacteria bacterium]|nr:FAD-dependent oxidoreductase [Actinomycetota bacterium]
MDRIVRQDSKVNNSLWTNSAKNINSTAGEFKAAVSVAIIGGGFSGLWSAFHLKKSNPSLDISIFEAKEIGFGASGRNGGWASSDYPVYRSTLIKRHGASKTELLFDALHQSIDEIGEFATEHAPKTGFAKSGTLTFARNSAQLTRIRGMEDDDHQFLTAAEVKARIDIADVQGGLFNPHCATVQPYELLMGLANSLIQQGVRIYTGAQATRVEGGVLVNSAFVAAEKVIQATEVFGVPGREFIPLYSLMVATEPLDDVTWREIGNQERFTFAESSHIINYAQRTVDGRLAIGGRGATYPFNSRLSEAKEGTEAVHQRLQEMVRQWFPILKDVKFTHAWGGAVAITRDWEPYLIWDGKSGFGKIGGYAGDGVTMSYLAAKALVAEISESSSPLRDLHFINRTIKKWEPEPLRYIAVNSLVKLSGIADKEERLTGRPSLLNRVIAPLILR